MYPVSRIKKTRTLYHGKHRTTRKMYLIFEDKTYMIRGAVFEVYKEMGSGFLEAVYQECLEKELMKQHIPFVAQKELQLSYKGEVLKQTYKPDLICFEQIVVEVKAVRVIVPEHKAQLLNYLKATNLKLGLLTHLRIIFKIYLKIFSWRSASRFA